MSDPEQETVPETQEAENIPEEAEQTQPEDAEPAQVEEAENAQNAENEETDAPEQTEQQEDVAVEEEPQNQNPTTDPDASAELIDNSVETPSMTVAEDPPKALEDQQSETPKPEGEIEAEQEPENTGPGEITEAVEMKTAEETLEPESASFVKTAEQTEEPAERNEPETAPGPEQIAEQIEGGEQQKELENTTAGEQPQQDPTKDSVEEQSGAEQEEKQQPEAPVTSEETVGGGISATAAMSGATPLSKANVSVKMVLAANETTTTAFPVDKPMKDLKQFLSGAMEIPQEFLELQYSGQILDDEITLAQLGATPAGTIELNLYSTNANFVTKRLQSKSDYVMPDVINVTVKDMEGEMKTINVEIERFGAQKPYLGGFRHKDSGMEFMNASCQTNTKLRPWDGKTRFCRDTQTVEEKQELQQTNYNTSTQMTGIGVYVSNQTDKLITPGKYETADEFLAKREDATVVIQSYFRRWASRNFVEGLRIDRDDRLEWEREEEIRKQREKEERIRKEFDRRMNPKSKEDFDLLFHALEKWRLEETAEINANLTGPQRKAALSMLLEQETQLIAAINRHKNDSDKVNKEKAIKAFLDKASAPKKWRGTDGKMTEMDTPYTLRALQLKDIYNSINMKYLTQDERLDILLTLKHTVKASAPKKWRGTDGKMTEMDTPYTLRALQLKDIYNSINMKYLTQDERLDILLTLKHTVKEHDCKLSQEIVDLIDREADLLMRGVKEDNLEGLRKRISTLFLQYCKTPAFNPEAARLIKVPQDPSTLRKGVYHCPSCGLYLPSTEFPLSSNSASPGKCRNCRKVDNDARTRQDYSHYVYMLRQLRLSEEKMADGSRIALLLQEQDLQYLVENIWGGQSALSQFDDLYDLTLVRWNKYYEWSPWNCILLTKEEAQAHERIENLDQAYRDVFLNRIRQKHSLARNYFSRLAGMAEKVRPVEPKRGKRVLASDQAERRKELTELFVAS